MIRLGFLGVVLTGSQGAKESREASLLMDLRKASEVIEDFGFGLTELAGEWFFIVIDDFL